MKAIFKGTPEEVIAEMKAFLNKIDCKQPDKIQEERYYPTLEDIPGEAEEYEKDIEYVNKHLATITPCKIPKRTNLDKEIIVNRPNIKDTSEFTIQKFTWDETKENIYKTIRFCELDDGNVMLFYEGSRVYTTKEKIMKLPYPVPFGYISLKCFSGNKKVAIRAYREYLNIKSHGQITEPTKKDATKLKTLEKKAEINKQCWNKDDVESKLDPKTKALREMVIGMGIK